MITCVKKIGQNEKENDFMRFTVPLHFMVLVKGQLTVLFVTEL